VLKILKNLDNLGEVVGYIKVMPFDQIFPTKFVEEWDEKFALNEVKESPISGASSSWKIFLYCLLFANVVILIL